MMCLLAATWVQLSVSADNGWPHNALRHYWLMPISCHFRDCKALLVANIRTDAQSDKWTGPQHYAPTSQECRRCKIICVQWRYRVHWFCDAERVLSTIVKFLVHLFGEREDRDEKFPLWLCLHVLISFRHKNSTSFVSVQFIFVLLGFISSIDICLRLNY